MATQVKAYSWRKNQENGVAVIDWSVAGDTIKVMLATSTYTPSTAHDYISDITNEVTGTNYTAGGAEITTKSVTESAGKTTVNGDDPSWAQSASGFSNARYAIIYKDTGTASTSPIVTTTTFASDLGNVSGLFTLEFAVTGIFTVE